MALDYEKRNQIRGVISQSKDPVRWFYPGWNFGDRDGLDWKNLKSIHSSGRTFAEQMRSHKRDIEADGDYTDDGKARRLGEYLDSEIRPKTKGMRDEVLSDLRAKARAQVTAARDEALQLPEHPFRVAASMRALDRVYAGVKAKGGPKKLRLHDLEQLDSETQRAIAATPPIVSGLSEHDHAVISRKVLQQEGGVKLAQAEEFLAAVETAEDALDFGEAVAEFEAGIGNPSPELERVNEARRERESAQSPSEESAK